MDPTFLFPAILLTLIAVILATTFISNYSSSTTTPNADIAQSVKREAGLGKSVGLLNLTEKQLQTENGLPPAHKQKCKEHHSIESIKDGVVAAGFSAVGEKKNIAGFKDESAHGNEEIVSSDLTLGPGKENAIVEAQKPDSKEIYCDPASRLMGLPESEHGTIGSPDAKSLLCSFNFAQTGTIKSLEDSEDMEEMDADSPSPKYVPGMLRTSQLEKMMTKDELKEEQRVQQEQLAAIFLLLKENKETFGEVSEGDVEEQLKLYSI